MQQEQVPSRRTLDRKWEKVDREEQIDFPAPQSSTETLAEDERSRKGTRGARRNQYGDIVEE